MTGIPKEIVVTYSEIAGALDKSISKIEESIHTALERTPQNCRRTSSKRAFTSREAGVAEGPRQAHFSAHQAPRARGRRPARGREDTYIALKNIDRFPFLAELIAELCATSLSFSHASIGGCSLWPFGRARWLG